MIQPVWVLDLVGPAVAAFTNTACHPEHQTGQGLQEEPGERLALKMLCLIMFQFTFDEHLRLQLLQECLFFYYFFFIFTTPCSTHRGIQGWPLALARTHLCTESIYIPTPHKVLHWLLMSFSCFVNCNKGGGHTILHSPTIIRTLIEQVHMHLLICQRFPKHGILTLLTRK